MYSMSRPFSREACSELTEGANHSCAANQYTRKIKKCRSALDEAQNAVPSTPLSSQELSPRSRGPEPNALQDLLWEGPEVES